MQYFKRLAFTVALFVSACSYNLDDLRGNGSAAKPTSPVLFAGNSSTLSKLVSGDEEPGFYIVLSAFLTLPDTTYPAPDATVTTEMLSAGDRAGLPTGVAFALQTSSTSNTGPAGSSLIVSFVFRFRTIDWIDSLDYPGFTFWARTPKGSPNQAEADALDEDTLTGRRTDVVGKPFMPTSTWTQFKFKWTDFGTVEQKQMGAILLAHEVPEGTTVDFQITAIKLATAAELL